MGSIALAIYPEERKKVALDTSKAVEIFAWGYKKGAIHMGISAAVAGFAALAAAFQTPPTGLPFSPRNYLLLLAPLHLANGVHTLLFMLPTNLRLLALREKATKKDSSLTLSDEQEVETLLRKWKRLHYVRLTLGAVGWVATLAVYMATL
ncbi:hypothetical protein JR316_0009188 [Psilocybe cubensis]|uniref:DUF1772-domain-containing protein n=2 Tax=Psilocybe cubensis TaxID=181762 RepID=A0A8H7XZ59_PSICU|nr:hypothetical protein JR316_0009188 [Psilocybe cubensis]KAH9478728.1 hypothetical protein JR316_0009188 [Psilocybe cubensis]